MSHPMWVRGLKLQYPFYDPNRDPSHPMWVRGLKLDSLVCPRYQVASHPMWVRGLKQEVRHLNTKNRLVAPYVGAWI